MVLAANRCDSLRRWRKTEFMKALEIIAWTVALALLSLPCAGQPACARLSVLASAVVPEGKLSLADLLRDGDEGCSQLRMAAARMILGNAPPPGAVRVLEGEEVRGLLQKLSWALQRSALESSLPRRIVVRRAGNLASCAEIRKAVTRALSQGSPSAASEPEARKPASEQRLLPDMDCGAATRIAAGSALEVTKISWDAGLRSWEILVRCLRRSDCVPFLIRVPQTDAEGRRDVFSASTIPAASPFPTPASRSTLLLLQKATNLPSTAVPALVRPGQAITLVWERAGIRLSLPVICLDRGGAGQWVRARTRNGSRILRAEVMSDELLRASL
jgi:hypothetical protein